MYRKFFAIALVLSFVITGGFLAHQQLTLNTQKVSASEDDEISAEDLFADSEDTSELSFEAGAAEPVPLQPEPDADPVKLQPEQVQPAVTAAYPDDTIPVEAAAAQAPEPAAGTKINAVIEPEFINVDTSYFEDALLIGDSRMVGIKEYGGLKEPVYFASTGLSTFKIYKEELEVKGAGKIGFEDLLSSRSFGKIYIMLGINEAGAALSEFKEQYSAILSDIKDKQPDALIFLCANLHVTKYKSEHDRTFANSHIDEINNVIRLLALKNGAYYLDVNPLYDDGEGNLSTEFAADYAHMYGRCYPAWIDWLCTRGIAVKRNINEEVY